ncbi:bifunctional metallophosphatase/5'-nucleotidase [Calidifontibacter terrae]
MLPSRLLGGSAVCALTFAITAPSAQAATNVGTGPIDPALTTVSLLNTNDFHGHFTKDFACTVTTAQNQLGAAFLSAGDNIGGSPFASAAQQDNPSIDYLNALGLQASAVGNHEFDKGFADLTGRVASRAQWTYLGANVYKAGTTTPALPEYKVITVNGVKVGVVGAVTQEVPSLVAKSGIDGLEFGDPVAAVNRVAKQLKDGNAANGEADIVIAEYHEGAPEGAGVTLAKAESDSPVFKHIAADTTQDVSAIFTGHTHQLYSWDGPATTGTRPVIQTDFYAAYLGVLKLGYDPATKTVKQYSLENRAVTAPTAACAADSKYLSAASIVDTANARADVIGAQPIGKTAADITTAYSADGSRDDRTRESTLSNMISQSYVDAINAPGRSGGVQIGVMNPGGVRAELLKGSDGTITYADAAAIMPFNNTIVTKDLTGAQFQKVLEEQWQPAAASRPFLKLGLSKNVTYTYDPNAANGSHITSVTVDGKPLDPKGIYKIASNSFLMDGGDNFATFAEGSNKADSGLIDQSQFMEWIKANSPLAPSFAKNGVAVENQPTTLEAGKDSSFTISGIDLTSLGAPTTTSVEVFLDGKSLGSFPVTKSLSATPPVPTRNESAAITIKVPADVASGAGVLTVKASQTGTVVTMPVQLVGSGATTTPTATSTSTSTGTSTGTATGTSTDVTGPPVVTDGDQGSTGANDRLALVGGAGLLALLGGAWVLGRRLS